MVFLQLHSEAGPVIPLPYRQEAQQASSRDSSQSFPHTEKTEVYVQLSISLRLNEKAFFLPLERGEHSCLSLRFFSSLKHPLRPKGKETRLQKNGMDRQPSSRFR